MSDRCARVVYGWRQNVEATEPRLSDEQLVELVDLIGGSDSVEFKLAVPEGHELSAVEALGMDPLQAQIRQVFYFDTPDLALSESGIIVRARRLQHRGDDSVVRLRPVVPQELSPQLRASPRFGVEVDAMPPDGYVCSGSMTHEFSGGVREAAAEELPVHRLFSKGQRRLFAHRAPEGIELDDLSVLGPVLVLRLKFTPQELRRRGVAELWLYPDDSAVLELSTKCAPGEAFDVVAELGAFLTKRGVTTTGEHETKTRRALELFAARPS
jgi:hypothetical protein